MLFFLAFIEKKLHTPARSGVGWLFKQWVAQNEVLAGRLREFWKKVKTKGKHTFAINFKVAFYKWTILKKHICETSFQNELSKIDFKNRFQKLLLKIASKPRKTLKPIITRKNALKVACSWTRTVLVYLFPLFLSTSSALRARTHKLDAWPLPPPLHLPPLNPQHFILLMSNQPKKIVGNSNRDSLSLCLSSSSFFLFLDDLDC